VRRRHLLWLLLSHVVVAAVVWVAADRREPRRPLEADASGPVTRIAVTDTDRRTYIMTVQPGNPGDLQAQPPDCWVITLFRDPPEGVDSPASAQVETFVARVTATTR
jgi:hypothetical protein